MLKKEDVYLYLDKAKDYIKANKQILKLVVLLLALMWVTSHVRGCIEEQKKRYVPPLPVQTAVSTKKDVPIYVESFGTLMSPENVDIKAQVTGKILEVNFKQGQEVSAGDLLFTIDPKEYAAEVEKAEAALEQDRMDHQLKKDLLERNQTLFDKKLIADQTYEQYKTDASVAEAKVELDKANLDLAKINLDYCYIRSPIDGLTGKRQVDIGNIISANTGPTLVNVKSIDILYVDFTLPERDLEKVRKAMKEETLKVSMVVEGDEDNTHTGELDFIDNTVNEDTGTFSLRATVDNQDRSLWSGQFVRIKLFIGVEKGAVIVPFKAAQTGKKGYYVFVVGRGSKVDLRTVTTGERYGDDIVIEKGIKSGEKVVTLGQLGLSPGMQVIDMGKIKGKKR
ncbi:efflux RND transporter periplasmic adaptor subunit [Candidatus Omnitrophota bacterium]